MLSTLARPPFILMAEVLITSRDYLIWLHAHAGGELYLRHGFPSYATSGSPTTVDRLVKYIVITKDAWVSSTIRTVERTPNNIRTIPIITPSLKTKNTVVFQ